MPLAPVDIQTLISSHKFQDKVLQELVINSIIKNSILLHLNF